MSYLLKIKYFILTLLFITTSMGAQTECQNALYDANKLFEAGQIKGSIDRLEPCLPSIHNKEELILCYHLLAQAFQNINEMDKSETYIRKMLKLKPDYHQFPNIDPLEFNRLVNQFIVTPKLLLGLKFGFNINSIALHQSYALYASPQRYLPKTGYQFGINGDCRLTKGFSINPEIFICGLSVNHQVDSAGFEKQNYVEQQNYFSLHLSAQKHLFLNRKLEVYAGLGVGMNFLLSSNVNLELTSLETNTRRQVSKNVITERNKFQPSIIGLFGVSTKLNKGLLSLETNYSYFLSNTVKASMRMSDLNFILDNQYLNDDISLRQCMINVNYKFPLIWNIQHKIPNTIHE